MSKMKTYCDFKIFKPLITAAVKYIVFKILQILKYQFTCEETVSVFLTISCTIKQIILSGTWCQVAEIWERGNLLSMLTVL